MTGKILFAVFFFACGFMLAFLWTRNSKVNEMKIINKIDFPTKYRYNFDAMSPDVKNEASLYCAKSPIWIKGSLDKNIFTVEAGDECKRSKAEFKLEVAKNSYLKFYVGAAVLAGGAFCLYKFLK